MRFLLCFEAEEVAKSQILMKRTRDGLSLDLYFKEIGVSFANLKRAVRRTLLCTVEMEYSRCLKLIPISVGVVEEC